MASDSAELHFLANYLRSSVCASCKRGLSEKYKMLLRTLVFGFPYVPPPKLLVVGRSRKLTNFGNSCLEMLCLGFDCWS